MSESAETLSGEKFTGKLNRGSIQARMYLKRCIFYENGG